MVLSWQPQKLGKESDRMYRWISMFVNNKPKAIIKGFKKLAGNDSSPASHLRA